MGPIELADVIGLDVCAYVGKVLSDTLGVELPGSLDDMVEAGHRGKKDGQGFYVWKKGKAIKPALPSDYTPPHDLEPRLILPILNESVAVLREKIVGDGDLLDGGVIFGTGFAPFRGGPINYAIETGVQDIVGELNKLAAEYGKRFKPDPGWKELLG
jgi:3-hydroxyacyl-CoA dehydrogenase/enoyl-CoA hydratase/3-hydroxybutyryl-CoA epimerase